MRSRAAAADRAAGVGVLSSASMVDLYSQIYALDDITGEWSDRADSLRLASAAAAASLLCRHGHASQSRMLALLEQLPSAPPHALRWIWRRLHGRSVETRDEAGQEEAGPTP